jgi:hypothetical protein
VILNGVDGQIIPDISKVISAVKEGLLGLIGPKSNGKKILRNVCMFLPVDTINISEH